MKKFKLLMILFFSVTVFGKSGIMLIVNSSNFKLSDDTVLAIQTGAKEFITRKGFDLITENITENNTDDISLIKMSKKNSFYAVIVYKITKLNDSLYNFNLKTINVKKESHKVKNTLYYRKIDNKKELIKFSKYILQDLYLTKNDIELDKLPKWLTKGAGAFTIEGRKVFRAIGVSNSLSENKNSFKESTENARKNLRYIMTVYVKSFEKVYKKHVKSGEMPRAAFKKDIPVLLKRMRKSKFSGAQVIDRWINPENKKVYTLLETDLGQIKNMIKISRGLSQQLDDVTDKFSDEAFELYTEILKESW